jgi:hypothetical protein
MPKGSVGLVGRSEKRTLLTRYVAVTAMIIMVSSVNFYHPGTHDVGTYAWKPLIWGLIGIFLYWRYVETMEKEPNRSLVDLVWICGILTPYVYCLYLMYLGIAEAYQDRSFLRISQGLALATLGYLLLKHIHATTRLARHVPDPRQDRGMPP